MTAFDRRARRVSAAALTLLVCGWMTVAPASAAAYRYWTYWQGAASGWAFATAGPGATVPTEGSVEGWRFAVTTQSGSAKDAPATPPDFAAICGQTTPVAGKKRVALVIDTGPADIAPSGQTPPAGSTTCVVADEGATGYQVLRSSATVRTDSGLICGIADYPTGECAPVVDDPAPAASSAPAPARASADVPAAAKSAMPMAGQEPAGSSTPWATIAVVLVVAGAVSFVWWRRRG